MQLFYRYCGINSRKTGCWQVTGKKEVKREELDSRCEPVIFK